MCERGGGRGVVTRDPATHGSLITGGTKRVTEVNPAVNLSEERIMGGGGVM